MLVFSPCMDCKHLIDKTENEVDSKFKCPSYPKGIPEEIFFDGSGCMCETVNLHRTHFEPFYKKL